MKNILLFDLDMTLLDFHASERKALKIVSEKNGLKYTEDVYKSFKKKNKELWLELEKGTITRKELFTIRFTYIINECGGDVSKIDPLSVNDDFIDTMSVNGVLMDGALQFVKRIKEDIKDVKIYIVSNGATKNAEGRIASTGLDKYIDGLFVSEDMGVNKPDAGFFEIVFKEISASREDCLMIGDSLSSDMLGAKNAGIASCWFMPQGDVESAVKEYDIDYTASDFNELYEKIMLFQSL